MESWGNSMSYKPLILALALTMTTVVQAEEIRVIPSDWEDYTYSEQRSFESDPIHQMKDETYSEAATRQYDLKNDTDFTLYQEFGITGE